MNNMILPPYVPPYYNNSQQNLEQELNRIRKELKTINERLEKLENKKNNDYLKKEDNFYIL